LYPDLDRLTRKGRAPRLLADEPKETT
jgi:hypothetical protein